jgi:Domain of unknown function (DUF4129)
LSQRRQGMLAGLVLVLGTVAAVAARGRVWSATGTESHSARILGIALVAVVGLTWLGLSGQAVRILRGVPLPSVGLIIRLAAAGVVAALIPLFFLYHFTSHDKRGGHSPAIPWYIACRGGHVCFYGQNARAGSGTRGTIAVHRARKGHPLWLWASVGSGLALLGAGGVAALVRSRRKAPADDDEVARVVSVVVDESLEDLLRESDARRAVIACYARMERTLARLELRREPFEAPLEYLERVLIRLRASARSTQRLTHLFEEAKFSHHVVDEHMRTDAIAALSTLRRELQVAR